VVFVRSDARIKSIRDGYLVRGINQEPLADLYAALRI
jgi:hypothetical protein